MRAFRNLRVTEAAFDIAVETYRVTAQFPRDERFGLVSQMRRAAVSIGSNIAEGCGRGSAAQLGQFLDYSSGSASELEFQGELSRRLGFASTGDIDKLCDSIVSERKMIARLAARIRAES